MRGTTAATALTTLLLPAVLWAQEPVRRFDELNTRLKVGDQVLLTDTKGQVHRGRILVISPSALTLGDPARRTVEAADVQRVEQRERDSLKNGALIGLVSGAGAAAGMVALSCSIERCESGDGPYMALAVGIYAGLGAAIGTGIDALIPGKKLVVYRASEGKPAARIRMAPLITPSSKAMAVRFSF